MLMLALMLLSAIGSLIGSVLFGSSLCWNVFLAILLIGAITQFWRILPVAKREGAQLIETMFYNVRDSFFAEIKARHQRRRLQASLKATNQTAKAFAKASKNVHDPRMINANERLCALRMHQIATDLAKDLGVSEDQAQRLIIGNFEASQLKQTHDVYLEKPWESR